MSSPTSPIKVGFCGYGYSTRTFHLPFVLSNPNLTVHAILQRNSTPSARGKPASSARDDFPNGDVKVYDSQDAFFADGDIELVVVATGHDSHAELAIKALKAKKHVIVEKCFTLSSAEADEVIAAQTEYAPDKVLTVFQNRRYDSDYRTLAHLITRPSKPLGKLAEVEFHYDINGWFMKQDDPEHHPGSGLTFGVGCHTIDQALALFGKPSTVTGFYRCLHGKSKEDDVSTIVLQYDPDGELADLVVTIKTSSVDTSLSPLKYWARGLGGTFMKFGEDPQERQTQTGLTPSDNGYGVEPECDWGTLTTAEPFEDDSSLQQTKATCRSWVNQEVYTGKFPSLRGSYAEYYDDVVRAIRGEAPLVITAEHARDGLRVIELGRQSADEGRTLRM